MGSPVCKQVIWMSANVVKGQNLKKTFLPISKDWSKALNHQLGTDGGGDGRSSGWRMFEFQ